MEQDSTKFLLLKIFVYSMGLVLIGGFIYMGASFYENLQKSQKVKAKSPAVIEQVVAPPHAFKNFHHKPCDGGKLELALGQDVANVEMNKRHIVITTEAKGTAPQKIVVIDFCDNKVISEIEIK